MLKEIVQHNNISIYWVLAMILVFLCSAVLASVAWVFYLLYWVFSRVKIFEKKNDCES